MANGFRRQVGLAGVALAAAGAVGFAWLTDAARRENAVRRLHRQVVDLLLNALTADDPVTARHSRRVADLAFALGEACGGLGRHEMATLRLGALLHRNGKTDDRPAQIQPHPHEGAKIREPLEERHPGLMKIVSSHHECWNGSGYPCGI